MAGTIKKLQFSEGTIVGTPTDLQFSAVGFFVYASDAAFVAANGTAEDGDSYYNSTSDFVRIYADGVWRNAVTDTQSQTLTNKTIQSGILVDTLLFATLDAPDINVTIGSGATLWHPFLTISVTRTYTINGQLVSAGNVIVNGTLIVNGTAIIL